VSKTSRSNVELTESADSPQLPLRLISDTVALRCYSRIRLDIKTRLGMMSKNLLISHD